MQAKELIDQIPATYSQLSNWIGHGVKIGTKSKGSGFPREYSETDVQVCKVLAGLAPLLGSGKRPLLGSGKRVPASKDIMKKVATQVRKEPSIADRDHIFVSTTGVITEEPKEGWVVSTGSRRGNT